MIELVIPNHKEELARLAEIGTSGFVVGFGLRFGQPDFFTMAIQKIGRLTMKKKITSSVTRSRLGQSPEQA